MRFVPVLLLIAHLAAYAAALGQAEKSPRLDFNGDTLPEGAIARLGTSRFAVPDDLYSMALTSDGTTLVVVTNGRELNKNSAHIELMSTTSGKIIRKLDLADLPARSGGRFFLDGKHLTITGTFGVGTFDAESGKLIKSIRFEDDGPSKVALSPDGKFVAHQPSQRVKDAPVYVYELNSGKKVSKLPGRGAACQDLAFSKDGKRLLLVSVIPTLDGSGGMRTGSDSKTALVSIDIDQSKIVGETTADQQYGSLGTDGETIAQTVANRGGISIRHLPTGTERCFIPLKEATYTFTPDGATLCTIDGSRRAALWNASTGEKIRDLEGVLASKDYLIRGISKDGKTIAAAAFGRSASAAQSIVVWNAVTGNRLERPIGHEGPISCIAYLPGNKMLASGSLDHTVRLWNSATGEHLRILSTHESEVTAIAISSDGKSLASASVIGAIRLTDIADGKLVREFSYPARKITELIFSRDSKSLLAGGEESDILAWDIASAKEVVRLKIGDGALMAFGDSGTLALTIHNENPGEKAGYRLQVWNSINRRSTASISLGEKDGSSPRCERAIISPNGSMIASSQLKRPEVGMLRLWERTSGEPIRNLSQGITDTLAFSPDGRLLAAGNIGTLTSWFMDHYPENDIWDVVTGKKIGTLPVTRGCIAFSPDGKQIATGCRDHTILIWKSPKLAASKKLEDPSTAVRDAWWAALGSNAKEAYEAIGKMIEAPDQSVELLNERVQPVALSDPDKTAKLIRQLDSENSTERDKAQKDLEKLGEGAAPQLLKALAGEESAESRRRIQQLLDKCSETSGIIIQNQRAVAVLEWIGTPAARTLLRKLADGAPSARLTFEANAALKRLEG